MLSKRLLTLIILTFLLFELELSGQVQRHDQNYNEQQQIEDQSSNKLYDSLLNTAYKIGRVPGSILSAILTLPDTTLEQENATESPKKYQKYEGKTIRNIEHRYVKIFGTSIFDTLDLGAPSNTSVIDTTEKNRELTNFFNRTHYYTKSSVIFKTIYFKDGDTINPVLLSESIQALRNLPGIYSARLLFLPVSGSDELFDVYIITQDVFPWGPGGDPFSGKNWSLEIWNQNLIGYGDYLGITLGGSNDSVPFFFLKNVSYKKYNISGTFLDFSVGYQNFRGYKQVYTALERNFYAPFAIYAGGITFAYQNNFIQNATDQSPYVKERKINYGVWVGRTIYNDINKQRGYALSLRYDGDNYIERPDIQIDSNQLFLQSNRFLLSNTYYIDKSYNARYVNRFGIIENIPHGVYTAITLGPDFYELYNRMYGSIEFYAAKNFRGFGYLNFYSGFGTYFHNNKLEQGVINCQLHYFSNALKRAKTVTRQFINIDYVKGINRFDYEGVNLVSDLDVGEVSRADSIAVSGTQKIFVDWSAIAYHRYSLAGFKVALVLGGGIGTVGDDNVPFWDNDVYGKIHTGLYIRNEHLVINTFNISLNYYPVQVGNLPMFEIKLTTAGVLSIQNFKAKRPEIVQYN